MKHPMVIKTGYPNLLHGCDFLDELLMSLRRRISHTGEIGKDALITAMSPVTQAHNMTRMIYFPANCNGWLQLPREE